MKVALVHDFLTQYGGAERFLEAIIEFFKQDSVTIYTLQYDSSRFPSQWGKYSICSIALQMPYSDKYPQFYASYFISRFENLDLSSFDLVFCSDLIFSKFVLPPPRVPIVSYQHTPASVLYPFGDSSQRRFSSILTTFQKSLLRSHEYIAIKRLTRLMTNSRTTAARIKKYYGREADVVYSFVDIPSPQEREAVFQGEGEFFLCVSRLVGHKRIDLAVRVCTELNVRLIVVGEGPELDTLKSIAGDTIEFKGFVSDEEKYSFIGKCKALIFPGEEDLGLTPLEVMAYGKPVIAYGKGGVTETVVEGETGIFFDTQSVESLKRAVSEFSKLSIDPSTCITRAEDFSRAKFYARLKSIVDSYAFTR